MGWRDTLVGTVSESKPIDNIDRTDKTPLFVNIGNIVNRSESRRPPEPQTRAGLRLALSEAREGLPVTLAELVEAFGAEGEADWLEGYTPHCHPRFLRAFAVAVSERLARERGDSRKRAGEAVPKASKAPHPLDGLPLLREDRRFIEARTQFRRDQETLLAEYARRWKEATDAEPVEHRKANVGRYAANTWLLETTR